MRFLDDPLADPDRFNLWDMHEEQELDRDNVEAGLVKSLDSSNVRCEAAEEAEQEIQDERILYDPISYDEIDEDWPEEEDDEQPDVFYEITIRSPNIYPHVQTYIV